jgi:hypothetical protein
MDSDTELTVYFILLWIQKQEQKKKEQNNKLFASLFYV